MDDACEREAALNRYPILREILGHLDGVHFQGLQVTVGPAIHTQDAYLRIRGLFVLPKDRVDLFVRDNPEAFKQWLVKVFDGIDFSQGCCFWLGLQRPDYKVPLPWICVEFEGGVERLFPLWSELRPHAVMVYCPVDYCIIATFAEENGWEMYRQP